MAAERSSTFTNALKRIRESIKTQAQVRFVFHSWMPFRNLGGNGFRLPCVPYSEIPTLTLIPIVSVTDRLFDSQLETRNNKYKPIPVLFEQNIEASCIDLITKFADRSLVVIPELDCQLDEAEEIMDGFDKMMRAFDGGLIQDLPEFWDSNSPVKEQLDAGAKRVKTTAHKELADLFKSGSISEMVYHRLLSAIPFFAASATTAHIVAIAPSSGILPSTIKSINLGDKGAFDQTDNFLRRNFPDFDTSSRISKTKENDSLNKLVDLLAPRLNATEAMKPITTAKEMIDSLSDEELQAIFAARGFGKQSEQEQTAAGDIPIVPEVAVIPSDESAEAVETETLTDRRQCAATNKMDGERCRRMAVDGSDYCILTSHQQQAQVDVVQAEAATTAFQQPA